MIHGKSFALLGLAIATWACSMESGTDPSEPPVPSDLKPEDASELEGSNLGSTQQGHALHYTDGTNTWMETAYPMGTANPFCQDYWAYDQFKAKAPFNNQWNYYTTYRTNHNWARGATIDNWMNLIPTEYQYNKAALVDHNTVVFRETFPGSGRGRCSGRYVFQWANHEDVTRHNNYFRTTYTVRAKIPYNLIPTMPPSAPGACTATHVASVPHVLVDLYVCEGPRGATIDPSIWCGRGSGEWRLIASSKREGGYIGAFNRCEVFTDAVYAEHMTPVDRAPIIFNAVVKAGIGHGVAPAEIEIYRNDDFVPG